MTSDPSVNTTESEDATPDTAVDEQKPEKKKKPSKGIKVDLHIHDRTQFEAVFAYLFRKRDLVSTGKIQKYQIEAFLFFPTPMGVTPVTYPKEKFYLDLRPLLRLREPRLNYKELIGEGKHPERSPLIYMKEYIEGVASGNVVEPAQYAIDEIRLFAAAYSSYLFRRIRRRIKRFKKYSCLNDSEKSNQKLAKSLRITDGLLKKAYDLLREWRKLHKSFDLLPLNYMTGLRQELLLSNEYCTYSFRDGLAMIIDHLEQCKSALPIEIFDHIHKNLMAYVRLERWYSKKAGFSWIDSNSSLEDQEKFVTRKSYLKKHVQKVLYLDARTKPIFSFQLQLAGILAAASAGAWAVIADIIIRTKFYSFQSVQTQIGVSGFLFLTALIMAYVLKDRIKEVGKSYFRGKLFSKIPDNSNAITYHSPSGGEWVLGTVSEYTKFSHFLKLPKMIQQLKAWTIENTRTEPEFNEKIIHYRKLLFIKGRVLQRIHQPVNAVHDIIRFNVQEFLPRLDDPLHRELTIDDKGKVCSVMMPKVYYLDIALRYSRYPIREKEEITYEFLRLVLNKDGLSRVDRLFAKRTKIVKIDGDLKEEAIAEDEATA